METNVESDVVEDLDRWLAVWSDEGIRGITRQGLVESVKRARDEIVALRAKLIVRQIVTHDGNTGKE